MLLCQTPGANPCSLLLLPAKRNWTHQCTAQYRVNHQVAHEDLVLDQIITLLGAKVQGTRVYLAWNSKWVTSRDQQGRPWLCIVFTSLFSSTETQELCNGSIRWGRRELPLQPIEGDDGGHRVRTVKHLEHLSLGQCWAATVIATCWTPVLTSSLYLGDSFHTESCDDEIIFTISLQWEHQQRAEHSARFLAQQRCQ